MCELHLEILDDSGLILDDFGHVIDDPLFIVECVPDFSDLGLKIDSV